jgi:hypothetical protein
MRGKNSEYSIRLLLPALSSGNLPLAVEVKNLALHGTSIKSLETIWRRFPPVRLLYLETRAFIKLGA